MPRSRKHPKNFDNGTRVPYDPSFDDGDDPQADYANEEIDYPNDPDDDDHGHDYLDPPTGDLEDFKLADQNRTSVNPKRKNHWKGPTSFIEISNEIKGIHQGNPNTLPNYPQAKLWGNTQIPLDSPYHPSRQTSPAYTLSSPAYIPRDQKHPATYPEYPTTNQQYASKSRFSPYYRGEPPPPRPVAYPGPKSEPPITAYPTFNPTHDLLKPKADDVRRNKTR